MRTTALLDTFETKVLGNPKPVLLKAGATWCGPCQELDPILNDLAEDLEGKVDVVSVDVDESPELAAALGVDNVPSLFVFIEGKEMCSHIGGMYKVDLLSWVSDAIEDYIATLD